MKKLRFLLLSLYFFTCFSAYALENAAGNAQSGVSFIKNGPAAWAEAEKQNLARAEKKLNELEVIFERRSLMENFGGFGTSIFVKISCDPEKSKENGGSFVAALPLYSGFAVDTGLALIEAALETPPAAEILVAFLGDEKTSLPNEEDGYSRKGLRDLISAAETPENWALCFLEFEDAPDGITIRYGDGSYLAPLEMIRPLSVLFKERGLSARFETRHNELYRFNLAGINEELAIAWEAEINAVSLGPGPGEKKSGEKMHPETLAEILLAYPEKISFPVLNPERYYSFYGLAGSDFFIGEKESLIIIIVFAALFLFFMHLYFTGTKLRTVFSLKIFAKFFWVFALFLPVLFLLFMGSGFLYGTALSFFKKPIPPAGTFGAVFQILPALGCFMLFLRLTDLLKIPLKENFFGFSALFLSFPGVFAASLLDFTYAPLFLWASFFSFLGFLAKKHLAVFAAAFLIPLPGSGALLGLNEGGASIPGALFFNPDGINPSGFSPSGAGSWLLALHISLTFLPSLLLFKKGMLSLKPVLTKKLKPERRNVFTFLNAAFIAFSIVLLALYTAFLPGLENGRAPVRRSLEDGGSMLDISVEETLFGESRILQLYIEAPGSPARYDISLESGGSPRVIVYSAPGPFEEKDGRIAFVLGENPPNPFSFRLVISRDFSGFINVNALYTPPENPPGFDAAASLLDKGGASDYVFELLGRRRIEASPTS